MDRNDENNEQLEISEPIRQAGQMELLSDEQMKGIYQKKQMLELVTNNAEVINIIGKPIIKNTDVCKPYCLAV